MIHQVVQWFCVGRFMQEIRLQTWLVPCQTGLQWSFATKSLNKNVFPKSWPICFTWNWHFRSQYGYSGTPGTCCFEDTPWGPWPKTRSPSDHHPLLSAVGECPELPCSGALSEHQILLPFGKKRSKGNLSNRKPKQQISVKLSVSAEKKKAEGVKNSGGISEQTYCRIADLRDFLKSSICLAQIY